MYAYVRPIRPDELFHHGVKGQKWGIRRFTNKDGSLTEEGKKHYNVDNTASVVGRALFNSTSGQKLAVTFNKGYKADKKAIKSEYKDKVKSKDKDAAKEAKAAQKEAIKKARVDTADAIYSHQSHAANASVQTESFGKQLAKKMVMGDYGNLMYSNLRNPKHGKSMDKGAAFVTAMVANVANTYTGGATSVMDYTTRRQYEKRKERGN